MEHAADVGIRAYGSSPAELFRNCALGMMSLMLDPEKVRREKRVRLEAAGRDRESLLVSWLSEILFRMETESFAFGWFEEVELEEERAAAWGWGEALDPQRHALRLEIKAVTYHGLELKEREGGWEAQVIFDV